MSIDQGLNLDVKEMKLKAKLKNKSNILNSDDDLSSSEDDDVLNSAKQNTIDSFNTSYRNEKSFQSMADSRKLVELHVQFAPYFELGEDESELRPECKPDVQVGELISTIAEKFLPKKFPVKFLRFCKNKKVIKNDKTIGEAFKKKGVNKTSLEIHGAIKLNLCA